MARSYKKAVCIFLCIIFIISMLLMFFNILINIFGKQRYIYGSEKCYINDDYIYTICESNGLTQIFDNNGDYLKTVSVESNGGTVWSGYRDALYLYAVRSNTVARVDGDSITHEKKHFTNPDEFYAEYKLSSKNHAELNKNIVFLPDGKSALLDAKYNIFSLEISIVLFIICFVGLFICLMLSGVKLHFWNCVSVNKKDLFK